ncbi:Ig-like domain-containing protein [Solimonas sp. K1W22B-7]|uniref:Ig-like domain-containing protein n=1 Tax=Solimonas sp. K1W22B-7 TaxID=2303331 RepID=UPI0013C5205B|nr:Ig-like domain-containing protein [Solimonas sp. K1W22B-7]
MDKRAATGFGLRAFIMSMLLALVTACGGGGGGGEVKVVTISVTPANATLGLGSTQAYVATGNMSNGSTRNLTSQVAWSSTSPAVASISASGLVTPAATGNTTIRAVFDGVTGSTALTVVPGYKEIQITPATPSVAKGLVTNLTATSVNRDDTTSTITATASWSSLNPTIAVVGNLGANKGRVTGVNVGTAQIQVSANGVQSTVTVTVTNATISSVALTPATANVGRGGTQKYTATATLSDGSTSDVSSLATWTATTTTPVTTPATTVATISNVGLATAREIGKARIEATVSGFTPTPVEMVVTAATFKEIQVDPAAANVPRGLTQQLTATSVLTDGTTTDITATANWSSSNEAIATVSTTGLVTPVANGSATITARDGLLRTGTAAITVIDATLSSIQVEPGPAVSLPKGGFTQQFTATGIFSDSTTRDLTSQVLWTSTVPANASISNAAATKGLATSSENSPGTTNITAKLGSMTSPVTVLTVSNADLAAISVTPANPVVGLGNTQQFTATASFSDASPTRDVTQRATWSSADETVATVSNAADSKGLAVTQSISATPVAISAKLGSVTGSANLTVSNATLLSIEVSPEDSILPKTYTRALQATGTYSDGSVKDVTDIVTWISSNSSIATVSNVAGSDGVVRGGSAGTARITAGVTVNGASVNDFTNVTVSDAVLESITVTPGTVVLPLGIDQAYTATGIFSDDSSMDLTSQVTWSSSDSNVASISNAAATRGQATSNAVGGPIVITATKGTIAGTTTPLTGTASLRVLLATVDTITVKPDSQTCATPPPAGDDTVFLPKAFTAGLIACASYSDGVVRNVTTQVTWSSDNGDVVTVGNDTTNRGVVSPVTDTRTVVRASLGGKSDSIPVEVTNATLVSIVVSPAGQSIFNNTAPIQFVATGTFSDTRTLAITRHVTWSASDNTVTVSNAAGSQGLVSPGRSPGLAHDVTITAARGSINDTETVNRRANAPAP